MNLVIDTIQLDTILEENSMVLVYFSGENCNVCHSFKPKVEALISNQFSSIEMVEIPTDKAPELVGRFRMFSVPGILLFVEGREYIREVRNVDTTELTRKIEKIVTLYQS